MTDPSDPKRAKSLVSNIQGFFTKGQGPKKAQESGDGNRVNHLGHSQTISQDVHDSYDSKIVFNPLEKERQKQKLTLDYYDKNKSAMDTFEGRLAELLKKPFNSIVLNREQAEKVIIDLKYLRCYEERNIERDEELIRIKQEYSEAKSRIMNQDSMVKNIEMGYLDKMNDLVADFKNKEKNFEEKLEAQLAIEEKQRAELKETNSLVVKQKDQINSLSQKCEILEKELDRMRKELAGIRKSYEVLNDVKKTKLKELKEVGSIELPKDFTMFITTNLRSKLFEFLDPCDLMNLRIVSKFCFQALTFDPSFFSTVTKNMKYRFDKELSKCVSQMNYFKRVAEKIPEEYLRGAIIKYICMKESLGSYMNPILNASRKLFEEDMPLDLIENPSPKEVEEAIKEEPAVTESAILKPEDQKEEIKKTERKSMSFFQKVFKIGESKDSAQSGSSPQKEKVDKVESSPSMKFDKNDLQAFNVSARKLAPFIKFTVQLEFVRELYTEKGQMISKANQQQQEFFKFIYQKIALLSKDANKLGNFMLNLQKNFCGLYVFSSLLLQEAKEIENLKNFLVNCNESTKSELTKIHGELEDMKESLQAEKIMKDYLQSKNKDLERKNHENDNLLLRNYETIKNLNQKVVGMEESITNLTKDKKEGEAKVKVLSNEIKALRNKNQELEFDYKGLINNCLDVKLLYDKLNLDV